jgi:hypothetical protein
MLGKRLEYLFRCWIDAAIWHDWLLLISNRFLELGLPRLCKQRAKSAIRKMFVKSLRLRG